MSVPSPASAASNSFTILSYAAMALGLDAGTTFGSVLGIVVAFPAVSFASPTTGAETSTGAGGGGAAGGGGGAFAAHSAAFSSPPSAATRGTSSRERSLGSCDVRSGRRVSNHRDDEPR